MGAADGAVAGRDRAAGEALDAEQVEGDDGAGDVGEAVEGADLVEVDLLDGDAVRGRLGLGQATEDAAGEVALTIGQVALGQDCLDVVEMAMGMLMRRLDSEL